MTSSLTEKQSEAIEKFKRLKVGALFMQMGTGKTRVALELLRLKQISGLASLFKNKEFSHSWE